MSETQAAAQTPGEVRVRVEDLPACHAALAKALGEAGIGGEKAHQLFATAIAATCIGCAMKITGEELGKIAIAGGENPTTENKLDRLRLGYCGRLGCNSKFYLLSIAQAEGINPAAVLRRAEAIRTAPPAVEPEEEVEAKPKIAWWRVPRNRGIAGAAVVLMYLGWRLFGPDGSMPIIRGESP